MNRTVDEGGVKPSFNSHQSYERLNFSRNTEITPRDAGILVSTAALTAQIENGTPRAIGGESPAQLALKIWLAELVQNNNLPYLGADTIGALAFRVGAVDKTARYIYTKSWWDNAWGLPGERESGKTGVIGGQWTNNDMLIALRLPLETSNDSNQVGLVQAGIFRINEGLDLYAMLKKGPGTQNIAELINLLFGLGSFGVGGDKANLKDTASIQLPGGFPNQRLAHAKILQFLANHYFNGEVVGKPKPHQLD